MSQNSTDPAVAGPTSPDEGGAAIGPRRYRDGLAQLLDLTAPPQVLRHPSAAGPTQRGFEQVGAALRTALAGARERFGE